MRSINLLFLIGFLAISLGGCSTPFGPATQAPVESTGAPRVADGTRASSANKPIAPSTIAAQSTPARPEATNSQATTRSPDGLFVALAALGIDYRYGGKSAATGFDCSGLVAHIYRDAYGMNLPPQSTAQGRMGKPIDPAQLETGDLVFYNTQGQPNTHVGIYIGDNRFIHAPRTGATVRIESMRGSYWKARFSGARRIVF